MDDWDNTLARLRRAFLDRVPALADEASEALARLELEGSTLESLSALRLAFHKLVGSGGTYGFNALAATATEGERLCVVHINAGSAPTSDDLIAWKECVAGIRAEASIARDRLVVVPSAAGEATAAPPTST